MLRFVVLLCAATLVKGQTTQVQQCIRNEGPLPINTYIAGCDQPPCNLPQLQDAVINISFRAPYNMNRMRTLATAFLSAISIPYSLGENAETCNFLTNTNCPVMKDEVIEYQLRMYIEPAFPVGVRPDIEFRIMDEQNNAVVCIRVPIRIVEAVNSSGGAEATVIDHA